MPRAAVEDSQRMNLRLKPDQKAMLTRAAALQHKDLTEFILQVALPVAKSVIEEADRVPLSERDSIRVLDLLENPPTPHARLRAASQALPPTR